MNPSSARLPRDSIFRRLRSTAPPLPPSGFRELDARVHYFVRGAAVQNFGDYLPELLVQALLQQPRVEADIYRLIGSVIESSWILRDLRHTLGVAHGTIAFWCCGMRNERPLRAKAASLCSFFGVRGPRTRDRLGLAADTVLGDPGLLAPLFHRPAPSPATSGRTICIPHIHDPKTDAELLDISGADVVVRPQIAATEAALRDILDKIAGADFVLTASLHGAIIACAYGRPFAFWDNGHVDIVFKWQDFAESVNLTAQFVKTVRDGVALHRDVQASRLRLPPLTPILDVCPFAARPSALARALAHDGRLDGVDVDTLARAFDSLASSQPAAIDQLRRLSAKHRALHAGLGRAIHRQAGSGVEAVKLFLRTMLRLS